MDTGNGSADGGKGTGGDAYANGGIAKSGDANVVNVAVVKQDSDQEMKVRDDQSWSSGASPRSTTGRSNGVMTEGTDRPR